MTVYVIFPLFYMESMYTSIVVKVEVGLVHWLLQSRHNQVEIDKYQK